MLGNIISDNPLLFEEAELFELLFELAGQLGGWSFQDAVVKNRYNDIVRAAKTSRLLLNGRVQPAADAVAGNRRFINLAGNYYRGAPVGAPRVGQRLDAKQRPADYPAATVYMAQAVIAVKAIFSGNHNNRLQVIGVSGKI